MSEPSPQIREWLAGVLAKTDPPPVEETLQNLAYDTRRHQAGQIRAKAKRAEGNQSRKYWAKPRQESPLLRRANGTAHQMGFVPLKSCPVRKRMCEGEFTCFDLFPLAPGEYPQAYSHNLVNRWLRSGLVEMTGETLPGRSPKTKSVRIYRITAKCRAAYGLEHPE